MRNFNDIGISDKLDWSRVKKLLTIGFIASLLHFAVDMIHSLRQSLEFWRTARDDEKSAELTDCV